MSLRLVIILPRMMICGNDAVAQRVALTGQNAIAQGIALGREILRNSSPERAKFDAPPPEKFRPFRAKPFRSPITQGDALGYRMLPRWGNPARRFSQIVMRGSIAQPPIAIIHTARDPKYISARIH